MFGSLLYLTASWLAFSSSVGVFTRFQANSKEPYVKTMKRIIKYAKETSHLGSCDDSKSTTGWCFYLGHNLISWHSRK